MGGSVGKVGSGNAYVYADNAPVMLTDPSGKGVLDCLFQLASYGAFSISLQELLKQLQQFLSVLDSIHSLY